MKYLHLSYIIQIKHCPIRGLSTNLWKIHVTRTRNLHPTHRHSLARFVESHRLFYESSWTFLYPATLLSLLQTKGLRSKRRNSPYIFQVVASLPTKACEYYWQLPPYVASDVFVSLTKRRFCKHTDVTRKFV